MAEVSLIITAKNQADAAINTVVSGFDRIKNSVEGVNKAVTNAFDAIANRVGAVYDAVHAKFNALPEVMLSAMLGATMAMMSSAVAAAESTVAKITLVMQGALRSMVSALGILAAVAIYEATAAATIRYVDAIVSLGQRLQYTTEQASYYTVAMASQRVSIDAVASANNALGKTLTTNEDAIKRLGIATRDSSGNLRSTADLLPAVNSALSGMTDTSARNAAALDIYGKKWNDLGEVLKINNATMQDARDTADGLGIIVGGKAADMVETMHEAQGRLNLATKALSISLGSVLIPVAADLFTLLAKGIQYAIEPCNWALMALEKTFEVIGTSIALTASLFTSLFVATGLAIKGEFSQAKVELLSMPDQAQEAMDHLGKVLTNWSTKPGIIKPVIQDFSTADKGGKDSTEDPITARIRLLWQELAVSKEVAASEAANEKGVAAIRLAALKGNYDAGLVTVQDYYDAVAKYSLEAAQLELKNAQDYAAKELEVLTFIRAARGEDSEEYRTELKNNEQATRAAHQAELSLDKVVVDNLFATNAALKTRNDAYKSLIITAIEAEGKYAEAQALRNDLDKQSVENLRLVMDAEKGVTNAVEALAAAEKKRAVASAEAENKAAQEARSYADAISKLQDDLAKVMGEDQKIVDANAQLRDGMNKTADLQDKIRVAWAQGNATAISGLSQQIVLQEQLNSKLRDNIDLQIQAAVLAGRIVGFSNGVPIYANAGGAFNNGQAVPTYVSPSTLLTPATGPGSSGYGLPQFTDINGNPVNNKTTAKATGDNVIHLNGGINVTVQGGTSGQQTAAEIARQVYPEIQKIVARQRA